MLHGRYRMTYRSRRGSAIVGVLVVLVGVVGIVYATGTVSVAEVRDSRRAIDDVRANYLAEAGIERGMNFLGQAVRNTSMQNPLGGLTTLLGGGPITPFLGEPVMNGANQVGAYTVRMTQVAADATSVTIAIDASGYLPNAPSALPAGEEVDSWRAVRSTVRYTVAPSRVFDYSYFLNNWGWFYGSTIYANGNARSNGNFDAGGYAPMITGQPIYDSVAWNGAAALLAGYQDDNNDGLSDGNDGGVWSGWDIVNAQNVRGNGGRAANQHEYSEPIPMPNLSDLAPYEANAVAMNGSITINGVQVSDAIYGDEGGEKQHLFLNGTAANPVVLNGPVVVRGDVLITGVVQGQGTIYSGRNIYVPKSVTYKTGPATPRPANNTQAATEAWVTANWNTDFLGLFARENVVVGDYTHPLWQSYVSSWMNDPMNSSVEDAGADGIPNTRRGRDGILGTADDDVLEADGVFTTEFYTDADEDLGLIPGGYNVGDRIPGTGEDIDGDGVYDPPTTMAAIPTRDTIKPAKWGGNCPPGTTNFNSIATLTAAQLDAVFYTNHSFCWLVLGGTPAKINGGLISRNENIIYGTPTISINQDCRLLGGASSRFARMLPSDIQPVEVLRWQELDFDPNMYTVAP